MEDSKGFIWFGTNHGITRYDGQVHVDFPLPDSLNQHHISVMIDAGNEVICGTQRGYVLRFNVASRKFTDVIYTSEFAITSLLSTKDSSLYIGTSGDGVGVIRNDKTQVWRTGDGLADNFIHDILSDEQKIYIATDLGL
ncbi:MAG: hypothetical protein ACKO6L_04985, partial [Flavobacteriales bacterium]